MLLLLVIAGAGFGYAMVHYKESPREVWTRLMDYVVAMIQPPSGTPEPPPEPAPEPAAAATAPEPAPALTAAPSTPPKPVPDSEPAPEPAPVDPFVWLLGHKTHAPRQVALLHAVTFPILLDGKNVGSVTIPVGTWVQLVDFTAETADVRTKNGARQVPVGATNLRELAATAQARAAAPKPLVSPLKPKEPAPSAQPLVAPVPRFTSPGVILNRTDLETLKANLGREPWKSGFAALASDRWSRLDRKVAGPFKRVARAPDENLWPWRSEMMSVWALSRMWYFTRQDAYAQKARDILVAWAATHTEFGGRECMLDLGDYAYMFVGGADILRGTWPGWTAADTATVKKYFNDVLIPASNPYGESQYGAANKGALALVAKGLMAIFNEDRVTLDSVVYQVRTLAHIGLRSSNDIGMLGDSLRDQGHAHGQLFSLAMLAEALWKQGIDIYADYDNRLLAAGEYFARVNTLTPTPFLPFGTTDAYYTADRTNRGWNGGRIALHLIHGAYAVRKGLPAPCVDLRLETMPVDAGNFMFIKKTDRSQAAPLPPPAIPDTAPVTSGFRGADIGGARPTGGATWSAGTWTVLGGGDEIWKNNDGAHFSHRVITGDCAIIAKVESVGDTGPSAKAGVMMRTRLDEGSPRAWMALNAEGNLEQNMPGLVVYGGTNYGNKVLARSVSSYWVKLERIGNIITGYVSPDGTNWAATDVGRIDAPVPEKLYVGLVVCSAVNGTPSTSTFSNVRITGGDGGGPASVPTPPAALLASPGDGAVPLRWQASFGAATYTVRRATTTGGPYATIASNITTSSYTDTTVTNGTTYYYVVLAVNPAGTSGNSPEDGTTPRKPPVNVAVGGTDKASAEGTTPGAALDHNIWTRWANHDQGSTALVQYGPSRTITRYSVSSAGWGDIRETAQIEAVR